MRFGATPERDGQTDGHRVTAYTALMHMHCAVYAVYALMNAGIRKNGDFCSNGSSNWETVVDRQLTH